MLESKYFLLLGLTVLVLIIGCERPTEQDTTTVSQKDYDARIQNIEDQVVDLYTYDAIVFATDDFNYLLAHSKAYKSCALVFLQDTTKTMAQHKIAIFTMLGLESEEYLDVLSLVFEGFKIGRFDSHLLRSTIWWVNIIEHPIAEDYNEDGVIEMLSAINDYELTPQIIKDINYDILAGNMKRPWLEKIGVIERVMW